MIYNLSIQVLGYNKENIIKCAKTIQLGYLKIQPTEHNVTTPKIPLINETIEPIFLNEPLKVIGIDYMDHDEFKLLSKRLQVTIVILDLDSPVNDTFTYQDGELILERYNIDDIRI